MKKLSIILVLLCFLFPVLAQNNKKFLEIGDKAPSIRPFKWIKGEAVDNFRKGHIYLIDFGATWCTPCAAAIPELNEIAIKYREKVTVMSVFVMEANDHKNDLNPSYVSRVEKYVNKRNDVMNYTISVDGPKQELEKTWLKAAGKIGIPYMYLVDGEGNITAIASNVGEIKKNIERLLSNKFPSPTQTSAIMNPYAYDYEKLLLINENGGKQDNFYFRSILTAYDGVIKAGNPFAIQSNQWWEPKDSLYNFMKDRVQLIDVSIADLYFYAYKDSLYNLPTSRDYYDMFPDTIKLPWQKKSYGKYWHLPVLEVRDSTPFLVSPKRLLNRFNYSLKVPRNMGTAKFLQQCLRKDLEIYFGFKGLVETRSMPYWKVIVTDMSLLSKNLTDSKNELPYGFEDDGLYYVYKNAEIRDLLWVLGANYGPSPYGGGKMNKQDELAYIDATRITGKMNFKFNPKWSFEEFLIYLKAIGIGLVKDTKPMKVVVIKDFDKID